MTQTESPPITDPHSPTIDPPPQADDPTDPKGVCTHIAARSYQDASDYYEVLDSLLGQIKAVFLSLFFVAENRGADDELLSLSCLEEDLAAEARRRAARFYDLV